MSLILSGTDGLSDVDGSAATPAIRGTDANTGIFFPAADTIAFAEGGVESMRIDSAGNLGLGVTPSAWASNYRALQIGSRSVITNGSNDTYVGNNWINDGTNKYIATAAASIYAQSAGSHIWYQAPSGTAGNAISFTQAMTLDASGRLGIGNTSPTRLLDVQSASTGTVNIANFGTSGAGGQGLLIGVDTTNSYAFIKNNTSASYGMAFFSGNGSEAARFDSSGNLLVGTTSTISSAAFTLVGNVANNVAYIRNTNSTPYGLRLNYSAVTPNNTDFFFHSASDATAVRFEVRSNGGIANYSANNVNLSDRREKTNFAPATSYLDKICAIPVQTFNYIDQNMEEDGGLTLGVIAQDVQAVAPELVMESNWASKDETPKMRLSIYQTDLQYALMKCIQEQQAIIESLKARLDAANL
jgi:hypothetical protein